MAKRTINGLEELERKLKKLEKFQNTLHDPMEYSVTILQRELGKQTRKDPDAFSDLAKPKQKRAYWARVRSGEIDHGPHGYNRNGSQEEWTHEVERTSRGLRGVVGNVKEHMRFVQGDWQQPFHKRSGYITVDEAVEKNWPKITRRFKKTVDKVLNR
jgi:hypothetical protein